MLKPNHKLFKGTFNFAGQRFLLRTQAKDYDQAYTNFIHQLTKHLKVGKRTVLFKFNGSIDNYFIEEVHNDYNSRKSHQHCST